MQGCFGVEHGTRIWPTGYNWFKRHGRIPGRIQGNHTLSGCFLRQDQTMGPFLVAESTMFFFTLSLSTYSSLWNSITFLFFLISLTLPASCYLPIKSWSILPNLDSQFGLGGSALCLSVSYTSSSLVFILSCTFLSPWLECKLTKGRILSQIKLPEIMKVCIGSWK